MSDNILELVQNYFGGDTVRQASAALGESEGGIGNALRSVVPLVLGGLFSRSQQSGGASELFGMAQQANSSGIMGNVSSLLGGLSGANASAPATDGGLLNKGTELVRSALGSQYPAAVESVSQQAGVRASTVSSLMTMTAPVALGIMGRHAASNNLDANGFGSFMSGQRSSIMGALGSLPGGLGNMLGGLGLGGAAAGLGSMASGMGSTVSAAASRTGGAVRDSAREVEAATTSSSRWPWLVLLLLGAAALFYFLRGGNKQPEPTATTTTSVDTTAAPMAPPAPKPAVTTSAGRYDAASGNYIYDTGANAALKLPDGTELNVGGNSVEARLFNFLNDNSQTVGTDKTQGWMSLDRVYFTTGKSTLTKESQAQLKNLAAILKAFPNATLKLGGYTDNKGPAAMNLRLSGERASAARKAVVGAGIPEARLTAEGYGIEHPIATNDTPEGRAQNRRVDVRVTKK